MLVQIRPTDFNAWLQSLPSAAQPVLLDVREPWELQSASVHADGFTLCTIPMRQLATRWRELDPEQATACLCHHGVRSQQVALFLAQQGFRQLANITGGIEAWALEHDPRVARY